MACSVLTFSPKGKTFFGGGQSLINMNNKKKIKNEINRKKKQERITENNVTETKFNGVKISESFLMSKIFLTEASIRFSIPAKNMIWNANFKARFTPFE